MHSTTCVRGDGTLSLSDPLAPDVGMTVWLGGTEAHSFCSAKSSFTLIDARMVTVAPPSMVRASKPGFLWEGLVLTSLLWEGLVLTSLLWEGLVLTSLLWEGLVLGLGLSTSL
jgi:hypothetical protein